MKLNRLAAFVLVKLTAPRCGFRLSRDGIYYDTEEERVYFTRNIDDDDCGFLRHMREYHENGEIADNFSLKLWTVLHEVGHYYTMDETEDDLDTRALCAMIPVEQARKSVEIQDMYFNIENEFIATDWAIDFALTHPKLCRFFTRLL